MRPKRAVTISSLVLALVVVVVSCGANAIERSDRLSSGEIVPGYDADPGRTRQSQPMGRRQAAAPCCTRRHVPSNGTSGTGYSLVRMCRPRCEDCGAVVTGMTCGELFDRLLALDHSRRQPWGPLHGQAVACYFLQHPHAPRAPRESAPLWAFLESFAAGPEADASPWPMTIHDVAVDSTFPALGYSERLRRWARSVVRSHRRDELHGRSARGS